MTKYTAEQNEWLKKNSASYDSYEKLTADFNKAFGECKTQCAINQHVNKSLGITLLTSKKAEHYTEAERQWIQDNFPNYETYADLTAAFNANFGRSKDYTNIRDLCCRTLRLIGMKNNGRFTAFHTKKEIPVGSVVTLSSGYRYVKVLPTTGKYTSGYIEPYWKPLQKKIWEDANGPVPEGGMIVFLDGNRRNCSLDNLYCIDRATSARLAKNGWYSEDGNLTLAGIKYCELAKAISAKKMR